MSEIQARCSALCGASLWWERGQEWNRCGTCGTLNYCEGGALPGLHPAAECLPDEDAPYFPGGMSVREDRVADQNSE